MLAGAGITAEIRDSRSDIASIPAAQIFVTEDQHAQATSLIASQVTAQPKKASSDSHPAAGFPVLGIMGFVAIIWAFSAVVLSAVSFDAETWRDTSKALLQLVAIGAMSLLWGLFHGAFVSLVCLIAKITWQKFRGKPAARANAEL